MTFDLFKALTFTRNLRTTTFFCAPHLRVPAAESTPSATSRPAADSLDVGCWVFRPANADMCQLKVYAGKFAVLERNANGV